MIHCGILIVLHSYASAEAIAASAVSSSASWGLTVLQMDPHAAIRV